MLFSEMYKTLMKEVTFVGFRGAIAPPGSAPVLKKLLLTLLGLFGAPRSDSAPAC